MKFPKSLPLRKAVVAACFALQFASRATTLVVTNNADSGPGTLRDCLAQANNSDTITFAITGVISNSLSDLVISNDISIIGPGSDALALAGNSNKPPRLFTVPAGVTASVSGLTLRDAGAGQFANGGGILNGGNLSVSNCVFLHCRSGFGYLIGEDPVPGGMSGDHGYDGGAIYSTGMVAVVGCDFFSNTADAGTDGSGGPAGPGGTGGNGGAIYATGALLATNCNFLTNSAGNGGIGGSGFITGISGSPHGSAGGNGGFGGAIYATGPATVVNCTFAYDKGGAGGTPGSGLSGTSAHPPGGNGGHGGNGGSGGAIFSANQLTLTCCTFYQNNAGTASGGGTAGTGYQGNQGGNGGYGGAGGTGVVYCASSAQITACTFNQNGAGNGGGGASGGNGGLGAPGGFGGYGGKGGDGGSVYAAASASVTLQNVLLIQDNAGGAGGGGAGGLFGNGTPTGFSGTNGLSGAGPDLFGTYTSLGHNYVPHSTGNSGFTNGINGDIVNLTSGFMIAPLLQIGPRTFMCTLPPIPTNAFWNRGDDSIVGPPLNITTDGHGAARLSGSHVDIGAYEYQNAALPITLNASLSNGVLVFTFTNVPGLLQPSIMHQYTAGAGWGQAGTATEIAPGVYQWIDSNITNDPAQFYEVRVRE